MSVLNYCTARGKVVTAFETEKGLKVYHIYIISYVLGLLCAGNTYLVHGS